MVWRVAVALFIITGFALADGHGKHVVVVMDDSGAMQDTLALSADPNNRERPNVLAARVALLEKLKRLPRNDQITIVSVALPQVVWQGNSREVLNRNNYSLAGYVQKPFNGCANFESVMQVVNRAIVKEKREVSDIIFLSSLMHTGGTTRDFSTCTMPNAADAEVPVEVLDAISRQLANTSAKVTFYWVFDTVADQIEDYFLTNGLNYELFGERASLQALSR